MAFLFRKKSKKVARNAAVNNQKTSKKQEAHLKKWHGMWTNWDKAKANFDKSKEAQAYHEAKGRLQNNPMALDDPNSPDNTFQQGLANLNQEEQDVLGDIFTEMDDENPLGGTRNRTTGMDMTIQ